MTTGPVFVLVNAPIQTSRISEIAPFALLVAAHSEKDQNASFLTLKAVDAGHDDTGTEVAENERLTGVQCENGDRRGGWRQSRYK
jgi:hypothetical protein